MHSLSSLVFVIIRVVSLALTVIVFHFGFGRQPSSGWNTPRTRFFALLVVSTVQVLVLCLNSKLINFQIYQMWLFLGNRVKKWREHKRGNKHDQKFYLHFSNHVLCHLVFITFFETLQSILFRNTQIVTFFTYPSTTPTHFTISFSSMYLNALFFKIVSPCSSTFKLANSNHLFS